MSTRKSLDLVVELESDVLLLEALIEEVRFFGELLVTEEGNPEQTVFNNFNYNQALDAYTKHLLYLKPRLEDYVSTRIENKEPVDIGFFRILKELRSIVDVQAK